MANFNLGSLFWTVEAQTGKFQQDLKKADTQVNSFAKSTNSKSALVTQGFGKLKESVQGALSQFGALGQGAGKLVGALNPIGLVAAAAGLAIFKLGVSAAKAADKILDTADATGISADTLQRLNFAAAKTGESFETISASAASFARRLTQLDEEGAEAGRIMEELGVRTRNSNGEFRDAGELYVDVIKSLQDIENPTQRSAYAFKILGRQAEGLGTLLNKSSTEFQGFIDGADRAGFVLNNKTLTAAGNVADKMDLLRASLKQASLSIGAEFSPAVGDVVDAMQSIVEGVRRQLQPLADFLSPLLQILTNAFKTVIVISQKFGSAISSALTTAALSPFRAFFEVLRDIHLVLSDFLIDAVDKIVTPINDWADSMKKTVDTLEDGEDKSLGLSIVLKTLAVSVSIITGGFKVFWSTIKGVISSIADLIEAIKKSGGVVANFGKLLIGKAKWEDVKASAQEASDAFKEFGKNAVTNAKDTAKVLDEELEKINAAFKKSGSQYVEEYNKKLEELKKKREELKKQDEELADGGGTGTSSGSGSGSGSETKKQAALEQLLNYNDALKQTISYLKTASKAEKALFAIEIIRQATSELMEFGKVLLDIITQANEKRIEQLDKQKEALLKSQGLSELSETEKAQQAIEQAKIESAEKIKEAEATGDALAIIEAKKAAEAIRIEKEKDLQRAQIEEAYQRKKAKLEYENNLASWKYNLAQSIIQGLMAPLNAFVSSLAIPVIGPVMAPISAAIAAATAAAQVAAVAKAKPQKPSFAVGAIDIPRDTDAVVHAKEMIIPKTFAEGVRDGELTIGKGGQRQINLTQNNLISMNSRADLERAARLLYPYLQKEGVRVGG